MLPTIRRADPFDVLREFDRAFSRWPTRTEAEFESAMYPVDIHEDNDNLIVEAELPGYTRDEIDVNIEQGILTISAQRKVEEKKGEEHLKERTYKRVYRRFSLPTSVNTEQVDAHLDNGVLTLKMPKREEVKPRKIEVK